MLSYHFLKTKLIFPESEDLNKIQVRIRSEMDGPEISNKIKSAIKAKLVELGAYVDDELPGNSHDVMNQ